MAVPTTSGTGSEVTPFATLWTRDGCGKSSIESREIIPNVAILDPDWPRSAGLQQTLFSGLDAISHCIETLWNRHKTPKSIEYAVGGLQRILEVFPRILAGKGSIEDFRIMQSGAMQGGHAISINHTSISHSISYPLTSFFGVPHGLACSFTIPAVWNRFSETDGRVRSRRKFSIRYFC